MKVNIESSKPTEKIYMRERTGQKAQYSFWIQQMEIIVSLTESLMSPEEYFENKLKNGYFIEVES